MTYSLQQSRLKTRFGRLQSKNSAPLRESKTLFKSISEPVQARGKDVFELNILNFTARENLLTRTHAGFQFNNAMY